MVYFILLKDIGEKAYMKLHKLLKLQVFLILLLIIAIPAASQEDSELWTDPENHTLYWGDTVDISGYSIKASDFSKSEPIDTDTDFVLLSIADNNSNSWSAVLGVNNSMFSFFEGCRWGIQN